MQRSLRLLTVFLATTLVLVPGAFAQCVSGTITSELMTTGPFTGLWKYTLQITWDLPQGLSNVALQCNFACGSAICDSDWSFDTPSGSGDGILSDEGTPGECMVDFAGEFLCNGNAQQNLEGPTIKWDALDGGACEAGPTGSATICFFVDLPPEQGNSPVILIKNGQQVCEGTVQGDCPSCPVAVEAASWSKVKDLYLLH